MKGKEKVQEAYGEEGHGYRERNLSIVRGKPALSMVETCFARRNLPDESSYTNAVVVRVEGIAARIDVSNLSVLTFPPEPHATQQREQR